MKKNLTELVFVVDRSGSMGGLESDTIGGLNATLAKNREVEGECIVSIVLFDNTSEVIVDRKPIDEVDALTTAQYQVRGCTALLDAVGDAIRHAARVQGYMPDGHKAGKVIFVIITDGQENASRRRTYAEVKQMIEEKRSAGWEFVFLGANIDAAAAAQNIGIKKENAVKYKNTNSGVKANFRAVNAMVADYAAGEMASGNWKKEVEEDK
jgi:uncharacterized protein YegL